jgi:hypothetical protein
LLEQKENMLIARGQGDVAQQSAVSERSQRKRLRRQKGRPMLGQASDIASAHAMIVNLPQGAMLLAARGCSNVKL